MDLFTDLYSFIFDIFTVDFLNLLKTKVGGVIEKIAPLFLIGFSIYVLLLGFNWLREGIDENLVGTAKSMIGWLLLIALAFNATNYMMVVTELYELPDKLGAVVTGVDFENTSTFASINDNVKPTINNLREAADKLYWYNMGQIFTLIGAALIIQVCSLLIFILVFAFYLIAKVSLLLTLFVGPIFIGFMLYPATRQYGMNWIGQILNFTFTIVLYIIANSLILQVSEEIFQKTYDFLGDQMAAASAIYAALVVLVFTILMFFVIFNIPSIASALTGGASVSASGGLRFLMGAKGAVAMRALIRTGGSMSKR